MNPLSAREHPVIVSVILPALNEERTIADCIRKIQVVFLENSIDGEILVADSSTDKTADIARSLGATVLYPEKTGYGNAYLAAFRHARGRYIIMGDADDTYDFSEIPRLLAPLDAGADFVIGSRFKGTIRPGSMTPLHQYIGNPLLTWMINVIFVTEYSDTHSGFRAITREALDRLTLTTGGMEFASEMLVMAAKEQTEGRGGAYRILSPTGSLEPSQFCRWLAAYPVCVAHEAPPFRGDPGPALFPCRQRTDVLLLFRGKCRVIAPPYIYPRGHLPDGWSSGHPHRLFDENLFGYSWVREQGGDYHQPDAVPQLGEIPDSGGLPHPGRDIAGIQYHHQVVRGEFWFPLGNLHCHHGACPDRKRHPDLSLYRVPEHDAVE